MKSKILQLKLTLLSLVLLNQISRSQQSFERSSDSLLIDSEFCGALLDEVSKQSDLMANRIPANPPGKSFRMVALYFKTRDDQFELGKLTAGWPHHKIEPDWKGQFLINEPYDSLTYEAELAKKPQSLTAYFHQMSNGHLWFYGDEITYTGPPLTEANSDDENVRSENWQRANARILQWLADQYDLSKLDNDKDAEVDLIVLICRTRLAFGFQGMSELSFSGGSIVNQNQIRITHNGGIYQHACYSLSGTRRIVSHEIGHSLGFGHITGLHRWSLMSSPHAGVTMSAYEKNWLGWLEYDVVDTTTLNCSLSNLTQSNRAIRIPIKGSEDYFVLENRQFSEPFEPYPSLPGTGLLIYYVRNKWPNLIPADGVVTRLIYSSSQGIRRRNIIYYGDNTDLFGNYGVTEITPYTIPSTSTPTIPHTGIAIKNIRYASKDILFDVYHDYGEENPTASRAPVNFGLYNYPNPFRSETKIYYRLPQSGHVKLTVYNLLGQVVTVLVDEIQENWNYAVHFDGIHLSSGIYFYVLESRTGRQTGKMIVTKSL